MQFYATFVRVINERTVLYLAFPETTTSILMAVFHANLGKPITHHSYSSICSGRKCLGISGTFFYWPEALQVTVGNLLRNNKGKFLFSFRHHNSTNIL